MMKEIYSIVARYLNQKTIKKTFKQVAIKEKS